MYVTYDIKGIQQFIFSVPRLKCIIGASSQIARFDDETVQRVADREGCELIFSGGGRGAIHCQTPEAANEVKKELIDEAREIGVDIRIGLDQEFTVAALHAEEIYPFVPPPEELAGLPCAESGLWPVSDSDGTKVHRLIEERIAAGKPGKDAIRNYLFGAGLIGSRTPNAIKELGNVEFLRNVNPEETRGTKEERTLDQRRAGAGQNALGKRNRWAVIAMDVNDMGLQFDALEQMANGDQEAYLRRLGIVSRAIKEVTHQAFANAAVDAMQRWVKDVKPELEECCYEERTGKCIFVPLRPLVLGGDDVVLLCHSALAMYFVRKMTQEFIDLSEKKATEIEQDEAQGGFNPWPATGGRLSISAGVLFTKVTLPLHTAVSYAESLLNNAKNEFRGTVEPGQPTPSAVDWETVTDTMVDTPAARRNREMRFFDEEIGAEVRLTRRPYLLTVESDDRDVDRQARSIQSLENRITELRVFPNTFHAALKQAMGKEWSERVRFCISMGKGGQKHRDLAAALDEPVGSPAENRGSAWFVSRDRGGGDETRGPQGGGQTLQSTNVVDAILLLEEGHRMTQETARR